LKPEAGGSWFFLVIERPDKKPLILDSAELSAISNLEISNLILKMKADGIVPIENGNGEWKAIGFREDFSPYTIPPSIGDLAKYIPIGTIVTLDNGCLPSIEWRFNEAEIQVFDVSDY
jgi:hypothetical protein